MPPGNCVEHNWYCEKGGFHGLESLGNLGDNKVKWAGLAIADLAELQTPGEGEIISQSWIQELVQGRVCPKHDLGASGIFWEMLLCQQTGDGGLTGNWTESMGWLRVGGMRETKVTQLGSDAPFQKVSSPGRRLGNREKKKIRDTDSWGNRHRTTVIHCCTANHTPPCLHSPTCNGLRH